MSLQSLGMGLSTVATGLSIYDSLVGSYQEGERNKKIKSLINKELGPEGSIAKGTEQAQGYYGNMTGILNQQYGQDIRGLQLSSGKSVFDLISGSSNQQGASGFSRSGVLGYEANRGLRDILGKYQMDTQKTSSAYAERQLSEKKSLEDQLLQLEQYRQQLQVQKAGLDTSGGLLGSIKSIFS